MKITQWNDNGSTEQCEYNNRQQNNDRKLTLAIIRSGIGTKMKPGGTRKENYQSLNDAKSGIFSSLHEKTEECRQQNCKRTHGKSRQTVNLNIEI